MSGPHTRLQSGGSRGCRPVTPRQDPAHSYCGQVSCTWPLLAADISFLPHRPLHGVTHCTAAGLTQSKCCRRKWERGQKMEVKMFSDLISAVTTPHTFFLFSSLEAIEFSPHSKDEDDIRGGRVTGTGHGRHLRGCPSPTYFLLPCQAVLRPCMLSLPHGKQFWDGAYFPYVKQYWEKIFRGLLQETPAPGTGVWTKIIYLARLTSCLSRLLQDPHLTAPTKPELWCHWLCPITTGFLPGKIHLKIN